MSKVPSILFIILISAVFVFSQEPTKTDPPSTGVAPKGMNAVGRADVRVRDEQGNPIKNAYVKLESTRTDGFFCESWNETDENGLGNLPALHMGKLKLKIKAKGYQPIEMDLPADQLNDPVRVTLKKK